MSALFSAPGTISGAAYAGVTYPAVGGIITVPDASATAALAAAFAAVGIRPQGSSILKFGATSLTAPNHLAASNSLALLGDSRTAQGFHVDLNPASFARDTNSNGFFNWTRFLSKGRYRCAYNGGVNGDRTDQMALRVANCINSGAGRVVIWGGVNDISQSYPTASTSGVTAFNNIANIALSFLAVGMQPIIVIDTMSQNYTSAQITQYFEMTTRLRELVDNSQGMVLFDVASIVMNPLAAGVAAFKPGYTDDGVHINHLAAFYIGSALKTLLDSSSPNQIAPGNSGALDIYSFNPHEMIDVGAMIAGGGAVQNQVTGTVPGGWFCSVIQGAATVVASVAAQADGVGNATTLDITFAGANDVIRFWTSLSGGPASSRMQIPEYYVGEIDCKIQGGSGNTNPSSLKGCELFLDFYSEPSTNHLTAHDNNPAGASGASIPLACEGRFQTLPHTFTQTDQIANCSAGMFVAIYGAAAGAAKLTFSRARLRHLALGQPS